MQLRYSNGDSSNKPAIFSAAIYSHEASSSGDVSPLHPVRSTASFSLPPSKAPWTARTPETYLREHQPYPRTVPDRHTTPQARNRTRIGGPVGQLFAPSAKLKSIHRNITRARRTSRHSWKQNTAIFESSAASFLEDFHRRRDRH